MPRFDEFRFLDKKDEKPPKVEFQAQKRDAAGEWSASQKQDPRPGKVLSLGMIYAWRNDNNAWQSPTWGEEDVKRIVVKVTKRVDDEDVSTGYILEEDDGHAFPVDGATLALLPDAIEAFLTKGPKNDEGIRDAQVQQGPWGEGEFDWK